MTRLYEKKGTLIRSNPNLTEEQKQEIIEVLNRYPNLENNVDWNKNKYLTYEDFKELILDKAGKSNRQAKKKGISGLTEGTDYDILYDKDGETLYAVYTHLASKVLASNRVEPQIWTESELMDWSEEDDYSGRKIYRNEEGELVELRPGAKWCISMNDSSLWKSYTKSNISFYFWFINDDSLEDYEKKIAISVDTTTNKIVEFTYGDDVSTDLGGEFPIELENLIFKNINVQKDKKLSSLTLNSETGCYDYKGNISPEFLKELGVIKVNNSGIPVGFTINFGKIEGDFICTNMGLTSLEGAPLEVTGFFNCSSNKLTSLEGSPKKVRDFICAQNLLTSLKGSPKEVGGSYNCSQNELISLEGSPKEINGGFCCSNNKLTSLEGSPDIVEGNFNCSWNSLTSLKGAPKKITGNFTCSFNKKLSSLEGLGDVKGRIFGL